MTYCLQLQKPIRLTLAAALLVLLFYLPARTAEAHSLDMFAQTQEIDLSSQGLQVDWKITPGPMLALGVWDQADQDHDGLVSPQEAEAWLMPFLTQWSLTLDGQPVTNIQAAVIHWPAKVDALQSGSDSITIRLVVQWPQSLSGSHTLEIHNTNQEALSLNWFSLAAETGLSFTNPTQSNGQLDVALNFGALPSGALTSWNSGQPDLAGLTGTVSTLANNLSGSPAATTQGTTLLSGPTAALVGLVQAGNLSGLFLVGAFLLSVVLGSLHALTPGHGKTLVAAYLVGSQGKVLDAIFLGSVVTLTHTGSVLVFGLLALVASRYIFPTLITPWLEVISGLVVVGFGLSLLVSRGRALHTRHKGGRAKKVANPFQAPRRAASAVRSVPEQDISQPGDAKTPHSHQGYVHTHSQAMVYSPAAHDHEHSHPHTHALPVNQITWISLLTLGISGGLVPCPDAIAILVVAVALGRIPTGMLLIVAFSLGLALVLIGIGVAMVQGMRFIKRNELLNRFSLYTPVLSAIIVSGLGIGLTLGAFHSLALSSQALAGNSSEPSATSTVVRVVGQGFDLHNARLVYLAQDDLNENQLTILPMSGGSTVALTQEPSGVVGFTIAPDQKSILYSTLGRNGASALWSVNLDGTGKRQVLDCPQAECGLPVWYPGSQKGVYQRHDYSQASTTVPMFSLWQLDLASGNTQPIFRDRAFPGIAPAFSPDGQWLSYISPATNTLQIYGLQKSQTFSLPLSSQTFAEELWSPNSDSLIYWEPASAEAGAAVHVKRYLLASGQKIDLGGTGQQADYQAAWSPDGQWVAIIRDGSNASSSSPSEQIWLVHPDGSGGHQLLQDQDSYSNLSWSPDGRDLAYVRFAFQGDAKPQIWLADVKSGNLMMILAGGISPSLVP